MKTPGLYQAPHLSYGQKTKMGGGVLAGVPCKNTKSLSSPKAEKLDFQKIPNIWRDTQVMAKKIKKGGMGG